MKIFRLILIFISLLLIAVLLHLWIYGSTLTSTNASNVLFVVGMITFLPTIIAMTQSYKVFQGFNYAFRSFLSTAFRQTYPKFSDYKNEKDVTIKTTIFLEMFIASSILVVAGIILSVVALR
ncbi:DUF3899 domain-containing protein [Mariniplasma anaerobium]|uniref:DUF3899 domain-containing protein n=1 Tax=Mariniplasma anaerobium TaxID=2735436 RepID=A0A7U9TKE4_9MOLU|nr:DUF3899 domain-containing protein [Mariniplasma anaerobium]BCR36582.1 hypothetical protein MPAN_014750 [Mariniplasma anaerobium]